MNTGSTQWLYFHSLANLYKESFYQNVRYSKSGHRVFPSFTRPYRLIVYGTVRGRLPGARIRLRQGPRSAVRQSEWGPTLFVSPLAHSALRFAAPVNHAAYLDTEFEYSCPNLQVVTLVISGCELLREELWRNFTLIINSYKHVVNTVSQVLLHFLITNFHPF